MKNDGITLYDWSVFGISCLILGASVPIVQ